MVISRLIILIACGCLLTAQTWQGNHDENKVRPYTLPDALTTLSGKKVQTADQWVRIRRPEILHLFEENVQGRTPSNVIKPIYTVVSTDSNALGGKAVRKQTTISFAGHENGPKIHVLVYLPANAKGPTPVFMGLNFGGNQTVDSDPGIALAEVWVRERPRTEDPRPTELANLIRKTASAESRGKAAGQWDIEHTLARGYGVATAYYGDVEPDFVGGLSYGVRSMFLHDGQHEPDPDEWGAIGAWAWGLSRIAEYLRTDPAVDRRRIAVFGHSRLGKAALWAGAQDQRLTMVISNNSGEGGAALSKRNFGEDIWRLNNNFPHWFSKNYRKYSNKEADLPVDHHMLLALIAPRPLYVASASEDLHSDPRGEFLAAVHAGAVYELMGKKGLGTDEMPGHNKPIMKTVAYHVRSGKHDVTAWDWDRFCDFADVQWARH